MAYEDAAARRHKASSQTPSMDAGESDVFDNKTQQISVVRRWGGGFYILRRPVGTITPTVWPTFSV
jgi:hypothetical protein